MPKSNKLDHAEFDAICSELWAISGGLRGIGATLQQQKMDPCYEGDELFGLGQLFETLATRLYDAQDRLRYCKKGDVAADDEENTADADVSNYDEEPSFPVLMKEFTEFLHDRRDRREGVDTDIEGDDS